MLWWMELVSESANATTITITRKVLIDTTPHADAALAGKSASGGAAANTVLVYICT
jgi:hypothetical protein